jgi:hypothetical protein
MFNVAKAIRDAERRDNLCDAEANGAWVIRRARTRRIASASEREPKHNDALSCFHGLSYTLVCTKCRRSQQDADIFIAKLKLKLSIV